MLLQYDIGGQLLTAIKSLYMHSEVCVRVNSATTKPFREGVGLRQGCSLSLILFLIYMDRIVKKSESCGGVKIGDCTCYELEFKFWKEFSQLVNALGFADRTLSYFIYLTLYDFYFWHLHTTRKLKVFSIILIKNNST